MPGTRKPTTRFRDVFLRSESVPYLDSDDRSVVAFEADSDSVLTKGLAALLVQGPSGRPVEEIVRFSPDFVVLLGSQQSLTPSRNHGFLSTMLKLMRNKALQLYAEAKRSSLWDSEMGEAGVGQSQILLNSTEESSNLTSKIVIAGLSFDSSLAEGGGASSETGFGSRGESQGDVAECSLKCW